MSEFERPANDDYVNRPGQASQGIPVQSDDAPVEEGVDPETADSDAQLGTVSLFLCLPVLTDHRER